MEPDAPEEHLKTHIVNLAFPSSIDPMTINERRQSNNRRRWFLNIKYHFPATGADSRGED
jgi:hypothetical protein